MFIEIQLFRSYLLCNSVYVYNKHNPGSRKILSVLYSLYRLDDQLLHIYILSKLYSLRVDSKILIITRTLLLRVSRGRFILEIAKHYSLRVLQKT